MKNNIKSSKKVSDFLKENNVHKKDFAQMIGVTLSYVYNIIDETSPFSTRSATIERIATVMDILPEDFEEYSIEQEPSPFNKNLDTIKNYIKRNKMKTVDFLKHFERKKRLNTVDILRGAKKLPINPNEYIKLQNILNLSNNEVFELWKNVFEEHLIKENFTRDEDKKLIDLMANSIKDSFIKSDKSNIS